MFTIFSELRPHLTKTCRDTVHVAAVSMSLYVCLSCLFKGLHFIAVFIAVFLYFIAETPLAFILFPLLYRSKGFDEDMSWKSHGKSIARSFILYIAQQSLHLFPSTEGRSYVIMRALDTDLQYSRSTGKSHFIALLLYQNSEISSVCNLNSL